MTCKSLGLLDALTLPGVPDIEDHAEKIVTPSDTGCLDVRRPLGLPDDVRADALVSAAFQTFFYVG